MLGVAVNIFMFNIFKLTLGSLRPNFIDVCHPIIDAVSWNNCHEQSGNYYFFGGNYTCINEDEDAPKIVDAKLSFYSGHSSLSFFFAIFIILYTHMRISSRWYFAFPLFIIFYTTNIVIAGIVAVSRITDHKHHEIDVIVGSLLGILIGIFTVYLHKDTFLSVVEKFPTSITAGEHILGDMREDQTTENTQV